MKYNFTIPVHGYYYILKKGEGGGGDYWKDFSLQDLGSGARANVLVREGSPFLSEKVILINSVTFLQVSQRLVSKLMTKGIVVNNFF